MRRKLVAGNWKMNGSRAALAELDAIAARLNSRPRKTLGFATPDEVPHHCITQGLGTIRRARHLVLLAFGEAKAAAVEGAVEGPVTASLPGSAIQLHPHVTVLVDEAAASRLAHVDYYRRSWIEKPGWQAL